MSSGSRDRSDRLAAAARETGGSFYDRARQTPLTCVATGEGVQDQAQLTMDDLKPVTDLRTLRGSSTDDDDRP